MLVFACWCMHDEACMMVSLGMLVLELLAWWCWYMHDCACMMLYAMLVLLVLVFMLVSMRVCMHAGWLVLMLLLVHGDGCRMVVLA